MGKKNRKKKLEQKIVLLAELNKVIEDLEIKEEDIIPINENGILQFDFNNPNHKKIYDRWMED